MANLGAEYDVVLVARSDGVLAADVRPLVQLSITVIVEENGRREKGFSGGGGRHGLSFFNEELERATCARRRDAGRAGSGLARRAAP